MRTWEYASVPLIVHAVKEILDQWGDQGWELVSVTDLGTGGPVAILKRPRGEAAQDG